jgi:hypothetical protein
MNGPKRDSWRSTETISIAQLRYPSQLKSKRRAGRSRRSYKGYQLFVTLGDTQRGIPATFGFDVTA